MKILSEFIHSVALERSIRAGVVLEQPADVLEVVFGVENEDYCVIWPDERELAEARDLADGDQLERGAGQPIQGSVRLHLPAGAYRAACYDPQTGLYSPGIRVESGPDGVSLPLPEFVHDLVVRLVRTR